MAAFSWNPHKNEKLIRERGISFEAILTSIQSGGLLDVTEHPNPRKYPGQKVFVIQAYDYVFLIPFEEKEEAIRLITIIPSRKAARQYLKRGEENEG
ncbi:MAG TPA: toxin [bacterium]|nr:toxin [bacterium]